VKDRPGHDKRYALDSRKLRSLGFSPAPVDIEDVDKIIDTLHNILNVYSASYDGQVWEKDLKFEHGIQNLLEAVKVGRTHMAK
jgi:dTDP-D-glucose 4,6-dehydratase